MLRPTFLSFETAKRALSSSQLGLDTVGHNISNINTAGYTRQRIDQVSISSGGYKAKYQAYGKQFPGQGSDVIGINQIRDPFLDKRFRDEAAKCGELGAKSNGLEDVNAIFDEIMTSGSHAKMGEFLDALSKLIDNADTPEHATVLRNKAQQIAQVINKNMLDLESVQVQQEGELEFAVADVNSMLEQIAMLNQKIKEDNFHGNPSNELNDQRNMLIDQLSEFIEIDVHRQPVKITDDLSITKISITIKGSDISLVDGNKFNNIEAKYEPLKDSSGNIMTDSNGNVINERNVSFHLIDPISQMPIMLDPVTGSNITESMYSGTLKGFADILNGIGPTGIYPQSSFRGIPYYKKCLNDYAAKFAETLNNQNRIPVMDSTGNPLIDSSGNNVYIGMPLMSANDSGTIINAKNIAVSEQWLASESFINATMEGPMPQVDAAGFLMVDDGFGGSVASLIKAEDVVGVDKDGNIVDTGGNTIPYASLFRTNTVLPGAAASDNLRDLNLALTGTTVFSNGFKGTFQEYLVNFMSDMSLDKELNDSMFEANYTVLGGLADSRDAVSAVNIDEEGINMMTFQNYYNAAARYMTTLDEALGTIIQNMGVVGR